MAARKTAQEKTPGLPAPTHRYTNDVPLIFPDLHHDTVTVHRATGTPDKPETGIVVLHPGDEITLPDTYEHAWLELINPPKGDNTGEEPNS